MADFLVLRLAAPLMSFGGVAVDNFGANDRFPGASWLTGLLGNALGLEHREGDRLSALQSGLRFGARVDRPGGSVVDYQTVELGADAMVDTGWTTWGRREDRRGGTASTGTHIRHRPYWADAVVTVCVDLHAGGEFGLDEVERALVRPERPLFLGRKTCLPSERIGDGRVSAATVREALESVGRHVRAATGPLAATWPQEDGPGDGESRLVWTTDLRDYRNQVHTGRRTVWEGLVNPSEVSG
ncbi:MAG: type I-E CRISPR-associated protein Cas5/CasD [Dehalococcoidia bacterium]|nr:type I-E CRISPR-associated protein Cas5/CasD [Dehalococcoidia bacterium]